MHEGADRAMVTESRTHLTATDPQMRLLIIEDDRESADYLVKAFREVGYVADLASDGEEGLSLADSGDYDVLVIARRPVADRHLAREGQSHPGADSLGARPG